MKLLKQQWGIFFRILLEPWTLTLLAITVFLAYAQVNATDVLISTALVVLIGLFSGVIGGRYEKRYSEITEERILVARGKTAIRGLTLLIGDVQALEKRVRQYLARHSGEDYEGKLNTEVIKTYLEETVLKCNNLEEQALSSIENWKDIIPEADIQTQIGIITELKTEKASLLEEHHQLRDELVEVEGAKEKSESEVRRLRKQIAEKEQEIAKLNNRFITADPLSVGQVALSSGSISPSESTLGILRWSQADEGEGALDTSIGAAGIGLTSDIPYKYCPNCGAKLDGAYCPQCQRLVS